MVKQNALLYKNSNCQFKQLPSSVIKELVYVVNKEFKKIKVPTLFVKEELNNFEELKDIFYKEKILLISSLHNKSLLFPGNLNLKFRAWHDNVHIKQDLPFNLEGEYAAFKIQSKNLSKMATQVLYSEIVLQTCYNLHFNKFPPTQKIILKCLNQIKN